MMCGPVVTRAGDFGPDYSPRGGGSAMAAPAKFNWEAHPGAWLIVAIFVAALAYKAVKA